MNDENLNLDFELHSVSILKIIQKGKTDWVVFIRGEKKTLKTLNNSRHSVGQDASKSQQYTSS